MMGERSRKAVVDRFEGTVAVLLVGEDRAQVIAPRAVLPRGTREGTWLQIELADGVVTSAVLNVAETEAAKKRIMEKLGRLRRGEHLKENTQRSEPGTDSSVDR